MKIKSHNKEKDISTESVKFDGLVEANYNDLVEVFGEPLEGDLYLTDVQWKLRIYPDKDEPFDAKLYNYKNGKVALGESGLEVDKIPVWHVAVEEGRDENATAYLVKYLKRRIKK